MPPRKFRIPKKAEALAAPSPLSNPDHVHIPLLESPRKEPGSTAIAAESARAGATLPTDPEEHPTSTLPTVPSKRKQPPVGVASKGKSKATLEEAGGWDDAEAGMAGMDQEFWMGKRLSDPINTVEVGHRLGVKIAH